MGLMDAFATEKVNFKGKPLKLAFIEHKNS